MELVIVPNVDALLSFKRAKLLVGDNKLLNTRFGGTVYYSLGGALMLKSLITNIKFSKKCAFCKYWYDPTNQVIKPIKGRNIWEYENTEYRYCMQRMCDRRADSSCPSFECKVPIL